MAKAKAIKPISKTESFRVLLADPREANDIFSDISESDHIRNIIYENGFGPDQLDEMVDYVDNYSSFQEFEVRVTTELIPLKKFTFKIIPTLDPLD